MAPTRLGDGTNIGSIRQGDGTEIAEVRTGAGDVVFTSEQLPVAYSNLVAWWPFDSGTYGGSNADDVTAIFNPSQSGDSTDFDGTVNGANYQSSGGVFDINAGANSGAFDFDGNDEITIPNVSINSSNFTVCAWVEVDNIDSGDNGIMGNGSNRLQFDFNDADSLRIYSDDGNFETPTTQSEWDDGYHWAAARQEPNGDVTIFRDDAVLGSGNVGSISGAFGRIGCIQSGGVRGFDGRIDDVRIYDTALSDIQIEAIYDNTDPNQNP